ncbi:MAG: hypothetical protein QG673_192 [Pseudomonadota bacterium]|nr:hypothetical protein [Euryarchaeota archaeon]MDQ5920136.1 hypothetical protein [Pseudomonadota bacterium]
MCLSSITSLCFRRTSTSAGANPVPPTSSIYFGAAGSQESGLPLSSPVPTENHSNLFVRGSQGSDTFVDLGERYINSMREHLVSFGATIKELGWNTATLHIALLNATYSITRLVQKYDLDDLTISEQYGDVFLGLVVAEVIAAMALVATVWLIKDSHREEELSWGQTIDRMNLPYQGLENFYSVLTQFIRLTTEKVIPVRGMLPFAAIVGSVNFFKEYIYLIPEILKNPASYFNSFQDFIIKVAGGSLTYIQTELVWYACIEALKQTCDETYYDRDENKELCIDTIDNTTLIKLVLLGCVVGLAASVADRLGKSISRHFVKDVNGVNSSYTRV